MKVLFFTGKGGVGKSTMSAAGAWQLSQNNRVLLVSLDPAHNIGDIFGITLNQKKISYTKNLFLKEVDLQQLSSDYLKREINVISGSYSYLQTLNLDNYFSVLRYSPGIEEYALLTSIEETIRDETEYDYIIFDTPPTGLTLRFLALPRVTITWIDRLTLIRQKILEKRYTIQKIRGSLKEGEKNPEIVLAYDENDDDVLKRLKRLNNNYQDLTRILEGEDCSIILVFNPDILSLKESQRLVEGLNDLNLPLRLLINNKVTPENALIAGEVEEAIKKYTHDIPIERVHISNDIVECTDGRLFVITEDIASRLTQQRNHNV